MSDIKILILQSGTTTTIAPDDNILQSGELAYTYADGDSAGGDRLFIGAGGGDGFATEVHTIGGKYYTDMMDHPKGSVVPSSAIITDADNKIDQLHVDFLRLNTNSLISTSGGLVLSGANGVIGVSNNNINQLLDPTLSHQAATKNYVDQKDLLFVSADVNQDGTGNVQTGKSIQVSGTFNTNTKRIDQPDNAVKVEVALDSDVLGLSRLTVDNIDVNGNQITTTSGDLTLNSIGGTVIIGGDLQVDGTTTTINSTELTIDDKNIVLASGAANATAADSAGIHVDGANADIFYDAPTDTWNFNKDIVAPNIEVDGTITVTNVTVTGGLTGTYSGFDSDFDAKFPGDFDTRFDSRLTTKTTDDLSEGNTNLYYTAARADSDAKHAFSVTNGGELGTVTYQNATGVLNYSLFNTDVRALFSASGDLSYDLPTGTFSIDVETQYTKTNFDSDLGLANTDQLPEGDTNLYYTTTRADSDFDARLTTKTTDDVTEGSNLYFTEERVDDRVSSLLNDGIGIDLLYNDTLNELSISLELASDTNIGGAKFDSVDFLVTAGNVELATIDCGTY